MAEQRLTASQQQESGQAIEPQQQRNFVIPNCSVVIHREEDKEVLVEELLAIAFSLANSNPGAKVDFWIRVMPDD